MRLSIKTLIVSLIPLMALAQPAARPTASSLNPGEFLHPPASAKPWVFWYWMQAAVSKEGIRADLQAMKSAGIGGAYLMPINGVANPPLYTPATPQLSPRWWEMVRFAMRMADSLHLRLAMHDCDGFAVAGGPWITPALSMQKIVWSRTTIDGGTTVNRVLPQPETLENYYEDVAVLAFPTPASWDGSPIPHVVTSNGSNAQFLAEPANKEAFKSEDSCWIEYAYERPFTCRTITIHSVNNYQSQRLEITVSDDGQHYRPLGRLTSPRHGWEDGDAPITFSMEPVSARYFRFIYDKKGSEPGSEDLDAAKWKPSLKLTGITLSSTPAIPQFEGKSGVIWRVSAPATAAQLPDSLCIDPRSIIDLTSHLDHNGNLSWQAPAGHWTILRIGHTSTGHTNATGGGGKGLECDKFNVVAIKLQFDHWFGEAIRQAGPELASKVLKIFHVDSWECGSQNWSPVFRAEFRRRRGYDLLYWLPAMAGVPVASADASERFLHDIRQTIAELLQEKFFTTMAGLAHAHGCTFSAECVAPTMVSDDLLHYSAADIPMGEFWLRSPTHDKPNDILDAVSGAHLYGKPIVQAEAFTELREAWDESPAMLKTLQDRNYALGINRLVFHVFTHNPWPDRKPGMTLGGVGTFLQRDQTWWPQANAWIDYTQRCQWLLQQGRPVADIAVFTGDELPRRAVLPERLLATLPGLFGSERVKSEAIRLKNEDEPTTKVPNGVVHSANMTDPALWPDPLDGYAFDSFNPDALLRLATVKNGRITLPGGASYGILVLPGATPLNPDAGAISAALAQRLLALVESGATILIDPVTNYHSNTLGNSRQEDSIVRADFRRLFAHPGNGRVIKAPLITPPLEPLGIYREFFTGDPSPITYTHRQSAAMDIYFLSNQGDKAVDTKMFFRATGRTPERWDPITGTTTMIGNWQATDHYTSFQSYLPAHGSIFVVFRRLAKPPVNRRETLEEQVPSSIWTLDGHWTVRFDTATPVTFDSLASWSDNPDSAIHYYSGSAVYARSIEWKDSGSRVILDLGKVADIATVTINGIDCGTVWTSNQLDISKALHPGSNELRITVTNTWANRLTGDQHLPADQRRTWTAVPFHSDGHLLPAGLLGPVTILSWKKP